MIVKKKTGNNPNLDDVIGNNQMNFNSVEKWLKATADHKCENKSITPCDNPSDDPNKLLIGHKCTCGETFVITGYDYVYTISELSPIQANNIRHMMTSNYGRKALAESLN